MQVCPNKSGSDEMTRLWNAMMSLNENNLSIHSFIQPLVEEIKQGGEIENIYPIIEDKVDFRACYFLYIFLDIFMEVSQIMWKTR